MARSLANPSPAPRVEFSDPTLRDGEEIKLLFLFGAKLRQAGSSSPCIRAGHAGRCPAEFAAAGFARRRTRAARARPRPSTSVFPELAQNRTCPLVPRPVQNSDRRVRVLRRNKEN